MRKVFNPPPNWPKPPEGWMPSQGWTPDPSWGPAPDGWDLYVDETSPKELPAKPKGVPKRDLTGKRRSLEITTNWVTAVTAVVALALSFVTYVQLNSEANV